MEVLTKALKWELEPLIFGNQLEVSARKERHFTFSDQKTQHHEKYSNSESYKHEDKFAEREENHLYLVI